MAKLTIKAPAKCSFDIAIEDSLDNLIDEFSNLDIFSKKIVLISETKIWNIYKDVLTNVFSDNNNTINTIIIDNPGDISGLGDLDNYYKSLSDLSITAEDYIIGFGGSNIISLAGFIASTFEGGIPLINIPTSLFSMTECSVNGKTSINYSRNINGLGNYYYPKFVYINTDFLNTLEEIHYYSGFAHIMRTAIIKSSSVYEWLIENLYEISDKDSNIVKDMIEQTINIERIYIEKDLTCKADRMVLNLGNAIANAIEKEKNYAITYGECLALGIIGAAHISLKRDMLSLDEYLEIRDMFVPFNLPITIEDIDINKMVENINRNSFILLKKIGKAVIDNNVSDEELKAALREIYFSEEDMME